MNIRRLLLVLATIIAAVVLLVLLVHLSGLRADQFWRAVSALGPYEMAGCLIGFALPVLIASIKWRSVVSRALRAPSILPNFLFFFHFSALSGVMGQVITPYAAGPIVRGLATKRGGHGGFALGASTSVLEQFFDAWASLIFAGMGILLFLIGVPEQIALMGYILAAIIGAVGVQVILVLPSSTRVLGWVGNILPGQRERLKNLENLKTQTDLINTRFVSRLYWLSVLRFWVLGVAVIAVASTFGEDWSVLGLLHVYATVQITRFAVFTPGNLGLAEWGWTTVLTLYGWDFATAALFSLTFRAVGLVFTCMIYVFAALCYLVPNWRTGGAPDAKNEDSR